MVSVWISLFFASLLIRAFCVFGCFSVDVMGFDFISDIFSSALGSFDADSVEGIIVILIVIGLIGMFVKKAFKGAVFMAVLLFGIEVLYFLGQTRLDEHLHLSNFFKYDVIVTFAAMLPGNRISYAILYVRGLIVAFIDTVVSMFA